MYVRVYVGTYDWSVCVRERMRSHTAANTLRMVLMGVAIHVLYLCVLYKKDGERSDAHLQKENQHKQGRLNAIPGVCVCGFTEDESNQKKPPQPTHTVCVVVVCV